MDGGGSREKAIEKGKGERKLSDNHIIATNKYDFGSIDSYLIVELIKMVSNFNDTKKSRLWLNKFLIWFFLVLVKLKMCFMA